MPVGQADGKNGKLRSSGSHSDVKSISIRAKGLGKADHKTTARSVNHSVLQMLTDRLK